jgi:hypothetical protein
MINEQLLAEIHNLVMSNGFVYAPNAYSTYCYYDKGWSPEIGGADISILIDEINEYFDITYLGEEIGFMKVLCSLEGKDITLDSINKEISKYK